MAGYTKNREENYEIKYLRKVLGQVDKRIQVPESVNADSLRRLLDTVEAPRVREPATRRPVWLSLQSGIAYAAAFALIVALFYATRFYRPDIISGGMDIPVSEQQPQETFMPHTATEAADTDIPDSGTIAPFDAAGAPETLAAEPAALDEAEPEADTGGIQPRTALPGVGGSGKSTLVLEQDEYAFYWRENDLSDPDRASPISFEVVDTTTQETVAQTDVPLLAVAQSFEFDGNVILVGNDLEGGAAICSYDISVPDSAFVEDMFTQDGEFVDANVYKNIVRMVSFSETAEPEHDSELLPGCVSGDTYVITVFDPETQATVTKCFIGANGTIQLHNLNAYIRYTGQNDDGETKDYIAQIIFDNLDITLGTVS